MQHQPGKGDRVHYGVPLVFQVTVKSNIGFGCSKWPICSSIPSKRYGNSLGSLKGWSSSACRGQLFRFSPKLEKKTLSSIELIGYSSWNFQDLFSGECWAH